MANRRWRFDSSLTIRLEIERKSKLVEAAAARNIPLSVHVRYILENGKLPEDLIAHLSERHKERLRRWARQNGKSMEDIVSGLLPRCLGYYLDNTG